VKRSAKPQTASSSDMMHPVPLAIGCTAPLLQAFTAVLSFTFIALHNTLYTPNCNFRAKFSISRYILECGRHFENVCIPVVSMIWAIILLISLSTELMPRVYIYIYIYNSSNNNNNNNNSNSELFSVYLLAYSRTQGLFSSIKPIGFNK
jgi:hypothetical protein